MTTSRSIDATLQARRQTFLEALPALHSWDDGKTWNSGGFEAEHLGPLMGFLDQLPDGAVALETGAGCSTLAMALTHLALVISIAPDAVLLERIRRYAAGADIDLGRTRLICDTSETTLPPMVATLRAPELDFALIDGGHGWPTPWVDLCFINMMLKPGGTIMLDDIFLHSVAEIARFLDQQPNFRRVLDLDKAVAWQRSDDNSRFGEWDTQPYIVARTEAAAAAAAAAEAEAARPKSLIERLGQRFARTRTPTARIAERANQNHHERTRIS